MSWLSSMANKWIWAILIVCALAALGAFLSARHYKNLCESLTAQILAEQKAADERVKSVEALATREREEYERRIVSLDGAVNRLAAERDRLHDRASALQKSLDTASAAECQKRSKQLVADIERGAAVAAKCASELGRKSEALTTCVRMYEDVKSVYDPDE